MVTRATLVRTCLMIAAVVAVLIGYAAGEKIPEALFGIGAKAPSQLRPISSMSFVLAALIITATLAQFLFEHRIWRGMTYAWHHWRITRSVKLQLKDAGYGLQRMHSVQLPKVRLRLNDLQGGELRIRNAIKFDKKLDASDVSSALGTLVVEQSYLSDDANWYVYELFDGDASYKLNFDSERKFFQHCDATHDYKLFLDSRSVIKTQHSLVVGATGSGKTYALYSLILQMLAKGHLYHLYFADPKGSSLAVLGEQVAPERTAVDLKDIIRLLGQFVDAMNVRKDELKGRLKDRLDADYSNFCLPAHVMIFDEYASFAGSLSTLDKADRDKATQYVREIVLQGRQLGFFILIAMQKSDSKLIDTAIRDSLTCKIVLGNAEDTTYTTAFGAGADIPNRKYAIGEGCFTEPTLANKPKLVQFPAFRFDILAAAKTRSQSSDLLCPLCELRTV